MKRLLILVATTILGACASLPPPAERDGFAYCKPASAIRYLADSEPASDVVRPAPRHGSCRHS